MNASKNIFKKSRKTSWMLQLKTAFPYGLYGHIRVEPNQEDIHVLVGKRFHLLSINHAPVTIGRHHQAFNVITPEQIFEIT